MTIQQPASSSSLPGRRRTGPHPGLAGGGLVALLAVVHLYGDALGAMLTALLPSLQQRFGLTATELAVLVAVQWLATSVSQPLLGSLSDRFGAARVVAVGSLTCAGLFSLMPVAPTATLLVVVVLVGGLGSAAFHPAAAAMARRAGGDRSDLAISLFSAGGTVGIALGPVLVIALVASYGLDSTPWLAVPAIALAVALLVGVRDDAARPASRRTGLDLGLLHGPIGLLVLAALVGGVGVISFTNGLVLWLTNDAGVAADDSAIGWTLTLFSLASAAGGIGAGLLARRFRRDWLVGGTLALAVLPFNAVFHVSPGGWAYYAVILVAGVLAHACYPILIVSAQHLAAYSAATAAALVMGFATGTAGVLYVGVGALQEAVGIEPALRLTSLTLLPAAWIAFGTLRRHFTGPNAALLGHTLCACATCRCSGCPVAADPAPRAHPAAADATDEP